MSAVTHFRWIRQGSSRLDKVAVVLTVLLVGMTAGWVLWEFTHPEPWAPLGPYPEQQVVSDREAHAPEGAGTTIIVPVAEWPGDLIVQGTKCNKEQVTVSGTVSWVSVNPPGTQVPVGEGVRERAPGCQSFTFENPVPDEVVERTRQINAAGELAVWRVTGTETPQREDGSTGQPLTWTTEPFLLELAP